MNLHTAQGLEGLDPGAQRSSAPGSGVPLPAAAGFGLFGHGPDVLLEHNLLSRGRTHTVANSADGPVPNWRPYGMSGRSKKA